MILHKDEIDRIDRIEDFNTRILEAAIAYCEAGFRIVPIRKGGKALPPKATGVNYTSSYRNPERAQKDFGPGGDFEGCNIGLVCGFRDGIFVVDADDLNEWDRLIEEHGEYRAPIQRTPRGGLHVVSRWREYLRPSTDALARGVDTRGGDGTGRSHIVAWPSVTPDGAYEWVETGEVRDTPDWISHLLGIPWNAEAGRGNEDVGQDDEETRFGIADIQAMLDAIEPNKLSYQEWLIIGQAINTQYPGNDGLELFDTWSRRGERYERGECHSRWQGFNPAGPIRIGSLIHFAKEGGYDISQLPKPQTGDFAEIIQDYNERCSVVLVGNKVRVATKDRKGNVHILGKEDFALLESNQVVTGASGKPVAKARIWLAHEDRRVSYNGIGFFPDKPTWHDGYVNLWRGWGVEPKKGDWSHFESHIRDIICGGDDDLNRFILDWLADIFQDPMHPKGTALVLHGIEGCGKGTLCYFAGRACGHHYRHITHESHLVGNFNSHMQDCLLAFGDEVTYGGSKRAASVLKALVTERELVCERKGVDAFQYENRTRLVVASNEPWFIPAGPNSRRWLVLDVAGSVANNRPYFDALYQQMDGEGTAAMMYDLLERDITSNLAYAPETEALQEQRNLYRMSSDPINEWIDESINKEDLGTIDEPDDGWPDVVDRILLYEAYLRWRDERRIAARGPRGTAHFYRVLESMGFDKFRPSAKGSKRRWKYRVPSIESLRGRK